MKIRSLKTNGRRGGAAIASSGCTLFRSLRLKKIRFVVFLGFLSLVNVLSGSKVYVSRKSGKRAVEGVVVFSRVDSRRGGPGFGSSYLETSFMKSSHIKLFGVRAVREINVKGDV